MEDSDAYAEITIAPDAMSAVATFYPPTGNGRVLSPDYIDNLLELQSVFVGIDSEAVSEAILSVNTDRRIHADVQIAAGMPAVNERPAYWEIVLDHEAKRVVWNETEQANFRDVARLPVVHPGDKVAERVPERAGVPGQNVRGDQLSFGVDPVEALQPGEHIRVEEDACFAEIGGQFELAGGVFRVQDRLEITGSVGYETGSIEFPGDVVLKCEVKDGFHIWAGRSITATMTIDVSQIYCRGDFTSKAGLIGRNKALLRCGGKVHARFASSCNVESKHSIYLDHYTYISNIGCQDRLAMGKKGRIVGGSVTAVNGVRAFAAGNSAGVPTTIRVGIDFIAERKLRLIREKFQAVTVRLQRLTTAAGDNPSDHQLDILSHLEQQRHRLAEQMGEVAGAMDANEHAELIIDGPVFPGVVVHVCRSSMKVEHELKKVRFRLEKTTGHVIAVPIDADGS